MLKAYRFRIYPNKKQVEILDTTLNKCRLLYNAMLELRIRGHQLKRKVNYHSQQNELPGIKTLIPQDLRG